MLHKQIGVSLFDKNLYNLYFNTKDMKLIEQWSNEECRQIFKKIKKNIFKHHHGLYSFSCPFCLKYELRCMKCKYPENHGNFLCNDDGSDWNKITEDSSIHKMFTNSEYRKMINLIEKDISTLKYL